MVKSDKSETSTLIGYRDINEPVPIPSEICCAPTNYLRVSRSNDSRSKESPIFEQFFIDVSLPPVPPSLPHVVSGTENLYLHTTRGPVIADVWVTGNNESGRVPMKLLTDYGKVSAKIHAFSASGGEDKYRPSLNIEVQANYGEVSLSLPRCFRGPMTIKCPHPRITFSLALKKRTALLSDVKDICVYFVGDRPRSWTEAAKAAAEDTYPEEPLDELLVHGQSVGGDSGVRIRYDGEPSG